MDLLTLQWLFLAQRAGAAGAVLPATPTTMVATVPTTGAVIYTPTGAEQGLLATNLSDTTLFCSLTGAAPAVNASLPLFPQETQRWLPSAQPIQAIHAGVGAKTMALTVWTSPLPLTVASVTPICKIASDNAITTAALSSSATVLLPLAALQDDRRTRRCRLAGMTNVTLTADLGADTLLQAIILAETNLSATGWVQVYYSNDNFVSEAVFAGVLYPGRQPYPLCSTLLLSPGVTRRYVQLRFFDPANADGYIEVGLWYAGPVWEPTRPVRMPVRLGVKTSARRQRTPAGVLAIDAGSAYFTVTLSFPLTSADEALATIWDLQRRLGSSSPCFLILFPEGGGWDEVLTRRFTLYGRFVSLGEFNALMPTAVEGPTVLFEEAR